MKTREPHGQHAAARHAQEAQGLCGISCPKFHAMSRRLRRAGGGERLPKACRSRPGVCGLAGAQVPREEQAEGRPVPRGVKTTAGRTSPVPTGSISRQLATGAAAERLGQGWPSSRLHLLRDHSPIVRVAQRPRP